MHPDVRLVVFDMAGTTVADTGHIPDAFAAAFAKHGMVLTGAQIAQVRGASKREAVRLLVGGDTERAETVYGSFRTELARAYAHGGIQPVPGVEEVFRRLRARGIAVALNTGLDRDMVGTLIQALRWGRDVIDVIVCGEDVRHGRPAPDLILRAMEMTNVHEPRAVVNVGDTINDVRAGRNAGVRWNVAVCAGAHAAPMLAAESPTHVLASAADLFSIF